MTKFEDNLWMAVVDRHGDDFAGAGALAATCPKPAGSWRAHPRLLAGATAAVAASATGVAVLSVATSSPAFAVTRQHNGSVTLKVSRTTTVAAVNAKLSAMGVAKFDQRATTTRPVSLPRCSAVPPGWKGEWVLTYQVPGSGHADSGGHVGPGVWRLAICTPDGLPTAG